jgi:hypothetical protein
MSRFEREFARAHALPGRTAVTVNEVMRPVRAHTLNFRNARDAEEKPDPQVRASRNSGALK